MRSWLPAPATTAPRASSCRAVIAEHPEVRRPLEDDPDLGRLVERA